MQAVLMVAGKSTRTYPLTLTRPKPLLPVLNRPLIEHSLDQMVGLFDQVILIVGYRQELIRSALGNRYRGIELIYQEQKEQLGTGHAILQAKPFVQDRFVALNGDDLFSREDFEKLLKVENGALVKQVEDPSLYGVYKTDARGCVLDMIEKPKEFAGDLANIGCYIFEPEVFSILEHAPLSVRGEIEIVDGILDIAGRKPFFTVPISGFWLPTGFAWDLLEHQDFFMPMLEHKIEGEVESGAVVSGTLSLGEGSRIRTGVRIEGPVLVGKGCDIGPNCYIGGGTVIGDQSHVESDTQIIGSLVMDRVRIGAGSVIAHTVLGSGSRIGVGVVTLHENSDGSNVTSTIKGRQIDSKRRFLGAVVADGARIGDQCCLSAGVKIWPDKDVPANVELDSDVMTDANVWG
ncbi:NTP transferase domain-containing protein [candidate division KSB1 bacterium]|nr:NTP transferase domain-containing protein [candidate division KSB1 bacterium]